MRAFTLVELLLTLAVVTILMALALPGLAHARSAARVTACHSNLRQLLIGAMTFGDDAPLVCPEDRSGALDSYRAVTWGMEPRERLRWLEANSTNVVTRERLHNHPTCWCITFAGAVVDFDTQEVPAD